MAMAQVGMNKPKVLVIEDEPDIIELLQYNLEREGFRVFTARDGLSGLKEATARRPALIILDLMLPGVDGLEVCRLLRSKKESENTPIIMLTAKSEESDKVLGLGIGADDYITKPFSPKELVARARAVLRRMAVTDNTQRQQRIEVGPLTVDPDRHEVSLGGKPINLTAAEFRLLRMLASSPGRVFTREQLLEKITGGESIVLDRNVDVHIGAIRKKLGNSDEWITTIRGVGYKFKD